MNAWQPVKRKDWPRFAVSPAGDRARFDCPGDVMPGWELEVPLAPLVVETISEPAPKRKAKA